MDKIETTILKNIVYNEEYSRKVIPFLKKEYFEDTIERVIFEESSNFIIQYNSLITKEALIINVDNRRDLNDDQVKSLKNIVSKFEKSESDFEWLVNSTEKWCRDRAIYLALMESIQIADGGDPKKERDSIPTILQEALAVSFDSHVGHDYLNEYEARFDKLHEKEERIPFDLELFNKITKGGLPRKTLNIILAGTGVGKSLCMCHMASSVLLQGKNVLYITLEMAEEKIAERIDANLLNIPIQDMHSITKSSFTGRVQKLSKKTQGNIIVKEYPTASAHSGHFKALINELALKKSFRPDIIFIDYLNICSSSRYRANSNINSYSYIKSIAEELRGLAVQVNIPIVSATQTTRSGYGSSDIELTDTSESFGLPATADLMFALISTEELENLGQILVKQLKNRYNDLTINKKFVIGIDRSKMRLYDCEQSAQSDIIDSGVVDSENSGGYNMKDKKEKFKGFNF
jgi:replicative DNA helicase